MKTLEETKVKVESLPIGMFQIGGRFEDLIPYGNGHINGTYLLTTLEGDNRHKYIFQKINTDIFKNPVGLMENIDLVTRHIREKLKKLGQDPKRGTLTIVPTIDGKTFYQDMSGSAFRMYDFVEGSRTVEEAKSPDDIYTSGFSFGVFQSMLSDFDASKLYEVIPDFHNTNLRYQQLMTAAREDKYGRLSSVKPELEFFISREKEYSLIGDALASGQIPMRVTHNDTKLNNILIDEKTGKGICVIDLDTVMPGSLVYDFGDSIRFGANTGAEDETDLSKISLSLELYQAYTKGFIEGCGNNILKEEVDLFPMAAKLMTLECGMRFLADYLNGDVYFHIAKEGHNLDRTRTQIALAADMEFKFYEMEQMTEKIYTAERGRI
ncbi:MAG: aminoglycoside phosphotransferase family protein [Pseudobutyrivibrio sp.]|nr:aminoglycoside phosphotransferase family protein [Pseudobutyrivibrio sp.]